MSAAAENQEIMEALNELSYAVEKKSNEYQEKIDKINQSLDSKEEANQKLMLQILEQKNQLADAEKRMGEIEVLFETQKKTAANDDYHAKAEYKALENFVIKGYNGITQEEKALLRTDIDSAGGYLTTEEMDTQLIKYITEVSPMRSLARVRRTTAKTFSMMVRKTIPVATFEGEAETQAESVSSYGSEMMTAYRLGHTVPVTIDQLQTSGFNMESEIFMDASEAFGFGEGQKFIVGTGVKQPMGVLSDTRVDSSRQTTASGLIDAESVIELAGDVKVGYDLVYILNRKTLAKIRTLKSTTGSFLWQPGINGVVANQLAGLPYVIMPDMPDVAANAKALAVGDFRRAYTIIDRAGMSFVRDDYTKATQAIVNFVFHKWVDGRVVIPEAIKILTIKA